MSQIEAKIQLLDNYVKEYKLELNEKIDEKSSNELNCSLGFGIINIQEKKKTKIGQIQLIYDIDILQNQQEVGKIHLTIEALFEGDEEITKEKFEDMLKYNGASMLSQIARAYLIATTSLGGMPTIYLPMINFVEFFKQTEKSEAIEE